MMRLGGVDEKDAIGGDLDLFLGFCVAEGFYERGYGKPGAPKRYCPTEDSQMLDGVGYVRDLIRSLHCTGDNAEAAV